METLKEKYKEVPEEKLLSWNRCERIEGKMEMVTKTGRKNDLLSEMVEKDLLKPAQGTNFMQHIHTAQWQQDQFALIQATLPESMY